MWVGEARSLVTWFFPVLFSGILSLMLQYQHSPVFPSIHPPSHPWAPGPSSAVWSQISQSFQPTVRRSTEDWCSYVTFTFLLLSSTHMVTYIWKGFLGLLCQQLPVLQPFCTLPVHCIPGLPIGRNYPLQSSYLYHLAPYQESIRCSKLPPQGQKEKGKE